MKPSGPDTPAGAAPLPGQGRIPELDGIRGLAILMVIVWHYVHLRCEPAPGTLWAKANMLFRLTWSGVDLFFVLSGFLIGGILLSQRDSPDYYRAFYVRRICRIFPLYFAFLLFCGLMQTGEAREWFPSVAWMFSPGLPFLTFATFTQGIAMAVWQRLANHALNITWSLALEEQFYLLLPLLLRLVPPRRLPMVLGLLMLGGIASRWLLLGLCPGRAGLTAYVLLPFRLDPLLLGVLGAWALRQPWAAAKLVSAARLFRASFLLLGVVWIAAAITAKGVIMSRPVTAVGYTLLGLFYFSTVMLVLVGGAPRLALLLRQRWLVYIGTISYGIYLLHELINGLAHSLILGAHPEFNSLPGRAVTALAFLATLGLAHLSWVAFEKPFVSWSHRAFPYRKPRA